MEDLLVIQTKLENEVVELGNIEEEIAVLNATIVEKATKLDTLATTIHDNRIKAIPVLSEKMIGILATLGMPNVRFNIEVTQGESYFANGKDVLQFLFSANKGTDFGLLKKVCLL